MSKFAKLKTLAAVTATVAAMFSAAPAQAYVYAVSYLNVDKLNITTKKADTKATYLATVGAYSFNQDTKAKLNGAPVDGSAECFGNGAGPGGVISGCTPFGSSVLDAAAVNGTGSTLLRTNNNFTRFGADNINSYSGADAVLWTSELVQGVPTRLEAISESLLNTNAGASASTLHTSNTALTFTTTLVGGGASGTDLGVDLDASTDFKAAISGLPGLYLASGNLQLSITATHSDGVTTFTWAPGLLNKNVTTGANPGLDDKSFGLTSFSNTFFGLKDGEWTIALSAKTSTQIFRRVPEPDSLALLGAALAGLAFATRRRSQKQQH